jgi:cupin fold WbuC family metalloprotein
MRSISAETIRELTARAASTARGRLNLNLHPHLDDPIQRFFNAVEPGSYVRPHRHTDPPRWEVFVALAGRAVVLEFDDGGSVVHRTVLSPDGPDIAVEIAGGCWHTVSALDSGTILFELKPGPYRPVVDKDFAGWAPTEDDDRTVRFVGWFVRAELGDRPPRLDQ